MTITQLFHKPTASNNFFIYIKRDCNPTLYLEELGSLYMPLNALDNLLREKIIDINNVLIKSVEITSILGDWNSMVEKRLNLLGTFYLQRITEILNSRKIILSDILKHQDSAILNRFKTLSKSILEKERINICLPFDKIEPFLTLLCQDFFSIPNYFKIIDRIEVAQPRNQTPTYPTLIIYLNEIYDATMALELICGIDLFFKKNRIFLTIDHTFADKWNDFVNVTQGFKLLKIYLYELNILEKIYSKYTNFAYVINYEKSNNRVTSSLIKNYLTK